MVNQKNKGLGATRNVGTKYATGEYIFYLDSDDYLPFDALNTMYEATENDKVDIIVGKLRYVWPDGRNSKTFYNDFFINEEVKEITVDLKFDRQCWELFAKSHVFNRLYRRKFVVENDIKCSEGLIFEDVFFNLVANLLAKQTKVVNLVTYNYLRRDNSIMTDAKSKRSFMDIFRVLEESYKELSRRKLTDYKYIFDFITLDTHLTYRQRFAELYDKSCIDKYSLDEDEYAYIVSVVTEIISKTSLETLSLLDDEKRSLYLSFCDSANIRK